MLCESLRDYAMKIINFKKRKMKLLTKEQQESYENTKISYIWKEKFENKFVAHKNYHKVGDYCHYAEEYKDAVRSICNLKYSALKKNLIAFHNRFNYDQHFTIKELAQNLKTNLLVQEKTLKNK